MKSVLRLFVALVALFGMTSAFTVVPGRASTMTRPAIVPTGAAPHSKTSTALPAVLVDQAIADMTAMSDPFGAILMMVLVVSFWELATPGRAKKEG